MAQLYIREVTIPVHNHGKPFSVQLSTSVEIINCTESGSGNVSLYIQGNTVLWKPEAVNDVQPTYRHFIFLSSDKGTYFELPAGVFIKMIGVVYRLRGTLFLYEIIQGAHILLPEISNNGNQNKV